MGNEASETGEGVSSAVFKAFIGAASVFKTAVLKVGRVEDEVFRQRLEVCKQCPGGHAIFGKRGNLKTCGRLFQLAKEAKGRKPCGCVLRLKARDASERCPFGFWPDEEGFDGGSSVRAGEPREMGLKDTAIESTVLRPTNVALQTDVGLTGVECSVAETGRTRRLLNVEVRRQRIEEHRREFQKQSPVLPAQSGKVRSGRRRDNVNSRKESCPASEFPSEPQLSLFDYFDRVVVVNLDRRSDRLERFYRHISEIDWPFRQPERLRAIDGRVVRPPKWWRAGAGAWGCQQSHVRAMEQALMDDLNSILILEDDVFFESGVRDRAQRFLSMVPENWQQIYLGGQHLFQRRQAPVRVNDQVLRPFNVNRTHAYALHKRGIELVYRWLTDYVQHAEHPQHHVDHRLGALHGTGDFQVYAPTNWLAGQAESHSNIKGKIMPTRLWNGHRVANPNGCFVAIVGLHRSGSSCLAGVLHKLGVHMGDSLRGFESTGGFEAAGLSRLCELAYPFPGTELKVPRSVLLQRLRSHITHVQESAELAGQKMAGGKYPHLCAMGSELVEICGDKLKVIHILRPLEESIASLKTRSRNASGWLGASDDSCEKVQRWLWESKQRFLAATDHLTVEFAKLASDPTLEVGRIVAYLGIKPNEQQLAAAIGHVRPHLRKHVLGNSTDGSIKAGDESAFESAK